MSSDSVVYVIDGIEIEIPLENWEKTGLIPGEFSGEFKDYINREQLDYLQSQTLGDVMALSGAGYVKSYGAGSIGTSSLQGTSAGHTQITWMGIPINSPGLGLGDLSLIPVELIDYASISTSAGAIHYGSGALGGRINIDLPGERANFSKNVGVGLSSGSFGKIGANFRANYRLKNIHFTTRALVEKAENDFPFLDLGQAGTPEVRQENAAAKRAGIAQNIYFGNEKAGFFEGKGWYVAADREIPPAFTVPNYGEYQLDNQLRTGLSWTKNFRSGKLQVAGAYFRERNLYLNPISSIAGANKTQSVIGEARFTSQQLGKLPIISLSHFRVTHENAASAGWPGIQSRTRESLYEALQFFPGSRFNGTMGVRQEWQGSEKAPLLPAVGWALKAVERAKTSSENTTLVTVEWKGNFGRNFRFPTLNDLYWMPGGNPQLAPEESWKAETGINFKIRSGIFNPFISRFESEVKVFANRVTNWILWQPGSFGFWSAENVQEVFARGVNARVSYESAGKRLGDNAQHLLQWEFDLRYNFTRSESVQPGSGFFTGGGTQLIYVPVHQLGSMVAVKWHRYRLELRSQVLGKRYTLTDLSAELPPVGLLDGAISSQLPFKNHQFRVDFRLQNILNTQYQAVQNRPMPGRNFLITLNWDFPQSKSLKP